MKIACCRNLAACWMGVVLLMLAHLAPGSARGADGIVAECTQEALEAEIADASDGDTITFECDGTILLTNTIQISKQLTLDATGHHVSIASPGGTNGVRLFTIDPEIEFNLIQLKFTDGVSTNGGALYIGSNALVTVVECLFSNNLALGRSGRAGAGASTNREAFVGKSGADGTSGLSGRGGAIYNLGSLELTRCLFVTNQAIGGDGGNGGRGGSGTSSGGDGGRAGHGGIAQGGAIYNGNFLSVTQSVFTRNHAFGGLGGVGGIGGNAPFAGIDGRGGAGGGGAGAAIFSRKSTLLSVSSCTFSSNQALGGDSADAGNSPSTVRRGYDGGFASGGGLASYGTVQLENCTFFANTAAGGNGGDGSAGSFQGGRGGNGGTAWGGNLFNGGTRGSVTALNCTFSDGGVLGGTNGLGGTAPFAGRTGTVGRQRGGNLCNSNGVVTLHNTIVAYPNPGANAVGKFRDAGFNLSSDRSLLLNRRRGSLVNVDPLLSLLQDNGGPVQTLELFPGSPAIDSGDTNLCLEVDARGVSRPLGAGCDRGAYEAGLRLLPPVIVTGPLSQTAQTGNSVSFRVVASGDAPLRYQWRFGSGSGAKSDIGGATGDTYTISDVDSADEGSYDVVVSNNSGSTNSASAALTVVTGATITDQSGPISVNYGGTFELSVTAEGDAPLRYQWYRNDVLIPGAILSSYSVVGAQGPNGGDYSVQVCNDYRCVTSELIPVTVHDPMFTFQPVDVVITNGETASFAVQAIGVAPLAYAWYFNATNLLAGATGTTFSITNAQGTNSGTYQAVVTNPSGVVTSRVATLSVQTTVPTIVSNPTNQSAVLGQTVTLTVVAAGSGPLRYQWYFNGPNAVGGSNGPTLTLRNVPQNETGDYYVVVSNLLGSVTSAVAHLTVDVPPQLTSIPSPSQIIPVGSNATFSVSATSTQPIFYQWYVIVAGVTNAVPGATSPVLNIVNAQLSDAGRYFGVASNFLGSIAAPASTLTVLSPPVLTAVPSGLSVFAGEDVTLSVTAQGFPRVRYQWYFNQTNAITDATNAALSITNVQLLNAGDYHVVVTNSLGTNSSPPATLTVTASAPVVTVQPVDTTAAAGSSVTLLVPVVGSRPLLYQWSFQDVPFSPLTNATFVTTNLASGSVIWITNTPSGSSLTITSVNAADQGAYLLLISNPIGTTLSNEPTITVP